MIYIICYLCYHIFMTIAYVLEQEIRMLHPDLWHLDLLYVYFYNILVSNWQFDVEFLDVAAASPSSCSPGDGGPVQPADVPEPMVCPATDERGIILKMGNIEYTLKITFFH